MRMTHLYMQDYHSLIGSVIEILQQKMLAVLCVKEKKEGKKECNLCAKMEVDRGKAGCISFLLV